jgi:hypothetical protein
MVRNWSDNILFRTGKPFTEDSNETRIAVNLDWPMVKAKAAQLYSQTPEVRLSPKHPQFAPAVPVFAKALNDTLKKAKVGVAVYESLIDCINASGFGAVAIGYERRTEQVEVPAIDLSTFPPEVAQMMLASGQVPMQKVDRTTSEQFTIRKISPADLLWPTENIGSDFDEGPWIGRSGLMSWAEAKNEFKLKDEDKENVCTGTARPIDDTLRQDSSEELTEDIGMVEFDEIYYWSYRFDADEKYFKAIRRIVFVHGVDKPVIDEPWNGQRFDQETGSYVGSCRFPIRVLTLDYVSDQPLPPSTSELGRPQVLELIKARTQMVLQRERSLPIRGFDVNKVDPAVQDALMRGTYQNMIPFIGDGSRAFFEVSRANYPREDFEFDRVAKQDLNEIWGLGPNQSGTFASGERSASEANIVQSNYQTQTGQERAKVGDFFVGIAEVLAGLLVTSRSSAQTSLHGWIKAGTGHASLKSSSTTSAQTPQSFWMPTSAFNG